MKSQATRKTSKSPAQLQREIDEVLGAPRGRRSHTIRSHHATKKPTSAKTDVSALATLFDLPQWDDVDERNMDYYWDAARGAGADEEDEEARERAEEKARDEVRDDLYNNWYDAVHRVAEDLFGEHGLELAPVGKGKRTYELKIVPKTNWKDAADKIRETVNGVGYFHFNNLKEFLDSGPYTAQQAVLEHIGYIRRYPEVYGSTSPQRMYESAMG